MKEQPFFKTLKMDSVFELREYVPSLLAKVKVNGPFEAAFKRGHLILQDYYSGENYKKVRMPVRQPLFLMSRPDGWEVACFLPSEFTGQSLPRPMGDEIRIEELLRRQVAVIKVTGKSHYPSLMRKTEELKLWAKTCSIPVQADSKIAVYQSSILPFMRRSEIHFDAC